MSNQTKKKTKLRIKDPKRLLIVIGLVILIIIIAILVKNNTIKKKETLSLIINNEDVTSKIDNKIEIKDNIVYLSLTDLNKLLEADFYQEGKKYIITTKSKISVIELNKNKVEINGSTIEIKGQAYKSEEDIIYLPISELKNVYDIDFKYSEEYKNIIMDSYSKRLEKARITRNTFVKEEKSFFSNSIEKVLRGDEVIYISEENGWAKVRTQNGNIGYIKKKKLTNFDIEREEMQSEQESSKNIDYKKDISKKNLEKYEDRKSLIEEILLEAVEKEKKVIKIIYEKDTNTNHFKRFKTESTIILKECGISLVFE